MKRRNRPSVQIHHALAWQKQASTGKTHEKGPRLWRDPCLASLASVLSLLGRAAPSCVALMCFFLGATSYAQWESQTFSLKPGWNAIYLEVQPDPNTLAEVFAGIPIRSVWTWNQRFTSAQYVRDPGDLNPEQPEWLTYFPEDDRRAFLTSLFAVYSGSAYLVDLGGDSPVAFTLFGELLVRQPKWLSDSFNLAGFPLDPEVSPTFADFFAPSESHKDQPIYRLNSEGAWERILNPSGERMRRGEAYWIYCSGQSSYAGPLGIKVSLGRALDYGRVLTEQMLRIHNSGSEAKTVTLTMLPSNRPSARARANVKAAPLPPLAGEVVLGYKTTFAWSPLSEPLDLTIEPDSVMGVPLAVLRTEMEEVDSKDAVFESVLEVKDSDGGRFLVPVSALKSATSAGLWVGIVTVDAVSEAVAALPLDGSLPPTTPTASNFQFRIIIHVDNQTQPETKLLQEVFLMQVDPELESARYVLLTDDSLLSEFEPVSLRNGELVGRRISTPAFAFPEVIVDGTRTRPPISLVGAFGESLSGTITMPFNDPLNPFVHTFHPDHNNLNELYDPDLPLPEGLESYTFSRQITLDFSEETDMGLSLPNFGQDIVSGTYTEILSGVHQKDIVVSGTFTLNLVTDVPVLNDGN